MSDGTAGAGGAAAELLGGAGAGAGGEGTGEGAGAGAGGEGGGGEGAGGEGAGGEGGADPEFFSQLSTEVGEGEKASLLDWAKSAGVKDINGLAKMARDNMAALRDSGRIKVPGEGASEAEIKAFRSAIGAADTVEGYAIEPPLDGEGNPLELDNDLLGRIAAKAHGEGMPVGAYKALVGEVIAYQTEQLAAFNAQKQAEAVEWAKSHGDKQPAKLAAVDRGAQALGLEDGESLKLRNALGGQRAMEILARIGEGVGEDVLIGGGSGAKRSFMNADQAQADIQTMMADAKTRDAIMIKGSPEHTRYNRLLAIVGEAANQRALVGG